MFPLNFGSDGLGEIGVMARPSDQAIKPGATYVFQIHRGQLRAWEARNREQNRAQPTQIELKFQLLNFGDGTGYAGSSGLALPKSPNEQSRTNRCLDPPGDLVASNLYRRADSQASEPNRITRCCVRQE